MWCLILWLYVTHITKYYYLLPIDFYARLFKNAVIYTHMQTHRLPVSILSTKFPRLTIQHLGTKEQTVGILDERN